MSEFNWIVVQTELELRCHSVFVRDQTALRRENSIQANTGSMLDVSETSLRKGNCQETVARKKINVKVVGSTNRCWVSTI
jgi:hypothetical protein